MRKKHTKITGPQIVSLGEILKEHCRKSNGEQYAQYDEGWSDQSIADQMDLTINQVKKLRNDLGLQLERSPIIGQEEYNTIDQRLTALEEVATNGTIDQIKDLVKTLVTKHNALCEKLHHKQFIVTTGGDNGN